MKLINLFGGPGTGKSTTAAGLFAELKHRGHKAELVTEVAKDLCYEKSPLLENQLYILSEQYRRFARLQGQVDVVVTDSPLALGLVYARPPFHHKWFTDAVIGFVNSFDNGNVFLNRVKPYAAYGRGQTEEEAREIDHRILFSGVQFHTVIPADRGAAVAIANMFEAGTFDDRLVQGAW